MSEKGARPGPPVASGLGGESVMAGVFTEPILTDLGAIGIWDTHLAEN